MNLITALLLAATAGIVASAQPHHKHHHHPQKREPTPVADIINVPGPTIIIYELNGQSVPSDEVLEGIKNGSLVYATGAAPSSSTPSATPTVLALVHSHSPSTSPAPITTTVSSTVSSTIELSSVTSEKSSTSSSTVAQTSSTSTSSLSSSSSSTSSSSSLALSTSITSPSKATETSSSSTSSGVYAAFPDGELDCSTFPSEYGAVALNYLGIGGWAGIQQPGSDAGGYSDIMTVTTGTCTNGDCCTEGSFCSYACPPGFQKSQWPSTQGSTGQSVGGIQCLNGKLRLTNPSMSTSLCMTGATEVPIMVQNTMNQNVAVCRTDYPGTESETIPVNAEPGSTNNLTCPAADNYYTWKGMSTSAQYYVNPAGVPISESCTWGGPSNPWGNYAPLNLGVGYSDGYAWLSIFQNSPTTDAKLGFSVELVGEHGGYDNLIGRCKYMNGQYCSGDGYSDCSSTTGCTVSVAYGTATYVFSS